MTRWLVLLVVVACAAPPAVRQPRVSVPPDVGGLVVDDVAFVQFSGVLLRDIEVALVQTPNDRDRRFARAMLEALADNWDAAIADVNFVQKLETDPHAKLMTGFTIRLWADARSHEGDSPEGFRAALERALAQLPVATVHDELEELRGMGHAFTPEVCRSLVNGAVRPIRGTVTFDEAQAIVFQRYAVKRLVPVGAIIDEVLGAHGIALPTE